MIVSKLMGRLGNQMFQYAAGRALAARHGTDLVLDSSWIAATRAKGLATGFELGCFDLRVQVRPVWEVARLAHPSPVVYALQRLRPSRRRFFHVLGEDSSYAFVPGVVDAPDDTYLDGFWQFADYFADHAELVRRDFTFARVGSESARLEEAIRAAPDPAVSVHVRRGDYVAHHRARELLGSLGADYYERAVETVVERVGPVSLFVFSDDPEWCRDRLRFPHVTTIVDRALPPERAWEDMRLMSLCRHHVIANSTFSWWGAWLNPSRSKVVVAPARWALDPTRVGDPIPREWTRIGDRAGAASSIRGVEAETRP